MHKQVSDLLHSDALVDIGLTTQIHFKDILVLSKRTKSVKGICFEKQSLAFTISLVDL